MLATLVFNQIINGICDTFRNHHICVAFRRFDIWWYMGLTTWYIAQWYYPSYGKRSSISRLIRRIIRECHHQYLQKAWYPSKSRKRLSSSTKSLLTMKTSCGSWRYKSFHYSVLGVVINRNIHWTPSNQLLMCSIIRSVSEGKGWS